MKWTTQQAERDAAWYAGTLATLPAERILRFAPNSGYVCYLNDLAVSLPIVGDPAGEEHLLILPPPMSFVGVLTVYHFTYQSADTTLILTAEGQLP